MIKTQTFAAPATRSRNKEFGIYFTLEDAYEADELAAHEKILGERRLIDNAIPAMSVEKNIRCQRFVQRSREDHEQGAEIGQKENKELVLF